MCIRDRRWGRWGHVVPPIQSITSGRRCLCLSGARAQAYALLSVFRALLSSNEFQTLRAVYRQQRRRTLVRQKPFRPERLFANSLRGAVHFRVVRHQVASKIRGSEVVQIYNIA